MQQLFQKGQSRIVLDISLYACGFFVWMFYLFVRVILQSEKRSSNFMYLMVEFPRVKTNDKEYSIVYYEKVFSCLESCKFQFNVIFIK